METPKPTKTRSITLGGLLQIAGWILALSSLAGLLGRFNALLDLFSHFRVQYFVGSLLLAAVFGYRRQKTETGVFAGFALINLLILQPHILSPTQDRPPLGDPKLRIVWWNAGASNTQHAGALDWIRQQNADLIAIGEFTPAWEGGLSELKTSHPHTLSEPRSDSFGMAIYSRIPLFNGQSLSFGDFGLPTLEVEVMVKQRPVRILTTHPLPPMTGHSTRERNAQLRWLAQRIQKNPQNIILVGDLNTTPWNHAFKEFIQTSGLRREPNSLLATWPSSIPPLKIPIDHALVSRELRITRLETGLPNGSDHAPLVVDINW